jgi:hypothetical protein
MKKTKAIIIILGLLLGQLTVFNFIPNVKANPAWLTGWSYRQQHNMTGATGAGTNYQIYLNVYRGIGTSSGNSVYLNNHNASVFPNDLNFTDNDKTTPLDYWVKSYNSSWAGVWIEVADSLESGTVPFYVYYGKAMRQQQAMEQIRFYYSTSLTQILLALIQKLEQYLMMPQISGW